MKGPVVVVPPKLANGFSSYYGVLHRQPIADAYLARYSKAQAMHINLMREKFLFSLGAFCNYIKLAGIKNVIVTPDTSPISIDDIPKESSCEKVKFFYHPEIRKKTNSVANVFYQSSKLGGAWDSLGTLTINGPHKFDKINLQRSVGVILWADHNDIYSIKIMGKGRLLYEFQTSPKTEFPGLQESYFRFPQEEFVDEIVVSPITGDGKYSVGRISVISESSDSRNIPD